jgi:hypothetical protein
LYAADFRRQLFLTAALQTQIPAAAATFARRRTTVVAADLGLMPHLEAVETSILRGEALGAFIQHRRNFDSLSISQHFQGTFLTTADGDAPATTSSHLRRYALRRCALPRIDPSRDPVITSSLASRSQPSPVPVRVARSLQKKVDINAAGMMITQWWRGVPEERIQFAKLKWSQRVFARCWRDGARAVRAELKDRAPAIAPWYQFKTIPPPEVLLARRNRAGPILPVPMARLLALEDDIATRRKALAPQPASDQEVETTLAALRAAAARSRAKTLPGPRDAGAAVAALRQLIATATSDAAFDDLDASDDGASGFASSAGRTSM